MYCKDGQRRGSYEHTEFTFLGFTFRARGARSRAGVNFTGFLPAVSEHALTKVSAQVRRWRIHVHTGNTLADSHGRSTRSCGLDALLRALLPTALYPLLRRINAYLLRWARGNTNGCGHARGRKPAGYESPATSRCSPTGLGRPHWYDERAG